MSDAERRTTITFSEVADGTVLTTQYRDRGIDFDGTSYVTSDDDNPTSPVLSGTPQFSGPIRGTFVNPDGSSRVVNAVRMDVGYINTDGTVAIALFNAHGEELSRRRIEGTGIVPIEEESSEIGSFVVYQDAGDPYGFAIDNLSFDDGTDTTYVALGDSYSSGEGTRPFDDETGDSGNGCHRSADGWPRLASDHLQSLEITAFFACSGALAKNITDTAFKGERPQAESLERLPGADPDVVSITIGGNDAGFPSVLFRCRVRILFCGRALDKAMKYMDKKLPQDLAAAYAAVEHAASSSRVVVVGYPNLMNTTSFEDAEKHCGWIHRGAWPKFMEAADHMDAAVEKAASAADLEYVSTLDALAGHELCTANSWIYPLTLRGGGTLRGHPILKGQQALAGTVQSWLAANPG